MNPEYLKSSKKLDEKLFPPPADDGRTLQEKLDSGECKTFEQLKLEWAEREKNYTLWDKIELRFWGFYHYLNIKYWNVRYFLQRNITQGYSDPEVFDFAHHTTNYILPRIKSLRANLHGHPVKEGEVETMEQWEAILDEIIWAMERYIAYEEMEDDVVLPEVFSQEYREDWDRIQNGFELMGKWWMGLWD